MKHKTTINWHVLNFGIVLDFEYPYIGIGLGPLTVRFWRGPSRPYIVNRADR